MSPLLQLSVHTENWPTIRPFRITGRYLEAFEVVVVELSLGDIIGRGEAIGIHYLNETAQSIYTQIEEVIDQIESGIERDDLLNLLPPGGARNAVDCALWDLEAQRLGTTVWKMTGIDPKPMTTVFTIGIEDTAEEMAANAIAVANFSNLKIKLDAHQPVERLTAIRKARPDAKLVVDANQGWSFEQLVDIAPQLAELGVGLIEQPLPRGGDELLEGYSSPIPLSADESCQHRGELEQAAKRYQIINIKLDKAGGLTEALLLAREAQAMGLELLASNMGGTSLSMAPGFVIAQLCRYIELDGPLLLKYDRFPRMHFQNEEIALPSSRLWG